MSFDHDDQRGCVMIVTMRGAMTGAMSEVHSHVTSPNRKLIAIRCCEQRYHRVYERGCERGYAMSKTRSVYL